MSAYLSIAIAALIDKFSTKTFSLSIVSGENMVSKSPNEIETTSGASKEGGRMGRPRMTTVKGGGYRQTKTRDKMKNKADGHIVGRTCSPDGGTDRSQDSGKTVSKLRAIYEKKLLSETIY